jgi:pyruvate formate lyase activating enzyme
MTGCIFDIQGFSVHDGPGCRTVVFMKGSTMSCIWCSNPEGIKPYPIPLYNAEKCIYDGLCVKACDKLSAVSIQQSTFSNLDELIINRNLCKDCNGYKCAEACNTGALKIAGYYITVDELFQRLERERDYWGKDGGMTLTGGEPFNQPEFALEILMKCYKSYIHTAIETCGNVPWKYYEEAINYIDWIFYDIKHINNQKHKEWTGVDNKLILKNAEKFAKLFKGRIIIRIPLIPGFNDSEKELSDIADFMNSVGLKEVNILPVHHLGKEKYKLLGLNYYNNLPTSSFQLPSSGYFEIFFKKGLTCYEGYKTPF